MGQVLKFAKRRHEFEHDLNNLTNLETQICLLLMSNARKTKKIDKHFYVIDLDLVLFTLKDKSNPLEALYDILTKFNFTRFQYSVYESKTLKAFSSFHLFNGAYFNEKKNELYYCFSKRIDQLINNNTKFLDINEIKKIAANH